MTSTHTTGFKQHSENPILQVGKKGEWDAGALGTMSVIKVGDTFHMYYEAWGKKSTIIWNPEDYQTLQIGHATSPDGLQWTKDPFGPVITKGKKGEWDEHGTWDPFVLHEDGIFKMWYGGGQGVCDWGYATSDDGVNFTKHGKISDLGKVEDIHIAHELETGHYHMYYWDRDREPLGLCHVVSPNETDFDYSNIETIETEGETGMYKFSHVIIEDGIWYMFYGDFERPNCPNATIKLATSDDGSKWKAVNRHILPGHDGEALKLGESQWLLYYGTRGLFDTKDCDINVASFQGELACLEDSSQGQAQ